MKKQIMKIMAFVLSGVMFLPSVPIYASKAEYTNHEKADYVIVAEKPAV